MTLPKAVTDAQSLQTTNYADAESNFSSKSVKIEDRNDPDQTVNQAEVTQDVITIKSQPTVTDAPVYTPPHEAADNSKRDSMNTSSSSSSDEPQRTRSQIAKEYRSQQRQGLKSYNEQNLAENGKSCLVQYLPCLGNFSCECIGSLCFNTFCNFGQAVKGASVIK